MAGRSAGECASMNSGHATHTEKPRPKGKRKSASTPKKKLCVCERTEHGPPLKVETIESMSPLRGATYKYIFSSGPERRRQKGEKPTESGIHMRVSMHAEARRSYSTITITTLQLAPTIFWDANPRKNLLNPPAQFPTTTRQVYREPVSAARSHFSRTDV